MLWSESYDINCGEGDWRDSAPATLSAPIAHLIFTLPPSPGAGWHPCSEFCLRLKTTKNATYRLHGAVQWLYPSLYLTLLPPHENSCYLPIHHYTSTALSLCSHWVIVACLRYTVVIQYPRQPSPMCASATTLSANVATGEPKQSFV